MAGKNKKVCFQGRLLQVSTCPVTLPNGYEVTLELVTHPGAVLIVPLLSADRVLLLRQYRPVIDGYLYELPAGTLAPGEKPLACARRELIEETGFRAGRIKKIGDIYPAPGYTTEKISLFRAEQLRECRREPEADEIIELLPTTRSRVRELLRRGKITDAKTICAFALCGWV